MTDENIPQRHRFGMTDPEYDPRAARWVSIALVVFWVGLIVAIWWSAWH